MSVLLVLLLLWVSPAIGLGLFLAWRLLRDRPSPRVAAVSATPSSQEDGDTFQQHEPQQDR